MAPPSGERIPRGYWICDACNSPNRVEYSPTQCGCGHYRNSCCHEAGSPLPNLNNRHNHAAEYHTGFDEHPIDNKTMGATFSLSTEYHTGFDDYPIDNKTMGATFSLSSEYHTGFDEHPIDNKTMGAPFSLSSGPPKTQLTALDDISRLFARDHGFGVYGGDFSRFAGNSQGSWTCPECGAANSSLTPNFCPLCGYKK